MVATGGEWLKRELSTGCAWLESKRSTGRSREEGSALLLALVAAYLVAVTVLLVAGFLQMRIETHRLADRDVQLAALSDAAMAETLASLADDQHFTGISQRPFGNGFIASTVTGTGPHRVQIEATGWWGAWQAIIEAEVDMMTHKPRVLSWRSSRSQAGTPTTGTSAESSHEP